MKPDDIFPDVSEQDRAAGRVSLRKALRRAASLRGDPWELGRIRQRLPL